MLQHKQESLVPLRTEWRFLESYLYLIQVRFRQQIRIDLTPPPDMNGWMIPPLALQMLVENAIKHNKASERQPLELEVYADGERLIVKNTLRPKPKADPSHGSGLNNLRSRYRYLSQQEVLVLQDEHHFIVNLPLIETTEA